MTAPETWRVECADGVVHEVPVHIDDGQLLVGAGPGPRVWRSITDPRTAVLRLALAAGWPVVAIIAPGEPTTAERVAAAVAAEREACAREADEAAHRHDADADEEEEDGDDSTWERGAAYAARDLAAVIRARGGA